MTMIEKFAASLGLTIPEVIAQFKDIRAKSGPVWQTMIDAAFAEQEAKTEAETK